MSHFYTVVLVPADTEDVQEKVGELLAPYDENTDVEPYLEDCWCVGSTAERAAYERLEVERVEFSGPQMAALRKLVNVTNSARWRLEAQPEARRSAEQYLAGDGKALLGFWGLSLDSTLDEINAADERSSEVWKGFTVRRDAEHDRLAQEHWLYKKPDPACEDCKGTGRRETTYNPKSKWDYWLIGGRWQGAMRAKKLTEEEYDQQYRDRQAVLRAMGGPSAGVGLAEMLGKPELAGRIDAIMPAPTADADEALERIERQFREDVCLVADLPPAGYGDEKFSCFAIVTPDGEWHEKGKMLMFGAVAGEKEEDQWTAAMVHLFGEHRDCLAVGCDLHI